MRRLMLLALALCGSGFAQTFRVELHAGLPPTPGVTLELSDLSFGEGRLGLRLSGGLGRPLRFSLSARSTETFGPAGNLSFRGESRFEADGAFETALGAEGVLGPVAGGATLALFAQPVRDADPFEDGRLRFLAPNARDFGLGLELAASYRVSRTLILTGEPAFYLSAERGLGLKLHAEGRFVRLFDPDDLRLLLAGYLEPGGAAYHAALGLEYNLNRPESPNLLASLWLGTSRAGPWPGGRLEFSNRVGEGRYHITLAAEPYRVDLQPFRALGTLEQPLGEGALTGRLEARLGGGESALRASFGYTQSW